NTLTVMYNTEKVGKESPNTLYKQADTNPNKIEIDILTSVMLFFNTTHIKITRGEIKLTYKKQTYFFEVPNDKVLKYHGTQVKVKYDPSDMSKVWIFDQYDNFICECFEAVFVNQSSAHRTENENKQIAKIDAKKKGVEKQAIKKLEQLTKPIAGTEVVHLADTYKDILNDAETLAELELFNMKNHFDASKARPMNNKQSRTEYEKSEYTTQSDLINGKRK